MLGKEEFLRMSCNIWFATRQKYAEKIGWLK